MIRLLSTIRQSTPRYLDEHITRKPLGLQTKLKIQDKAVHAKFKEKVGSVESYSSYDND